LIVGVVVVVAVAFTQLRQAGRQGKRFFSGPLGLVMIVTLALLIGVLAMVFGQNLALGGNRIGGGAAVAALAALILARLVESRRARESKSS
jgi:hypothetical protein